jgi:hypothetical protein
MSMIAAMFLLFSPASDAGDFDAAYVCKVFENSGVSREIPVNFTLKNHKLREIVFTDNGTKSIEKYSENQVLGNSASIYVALPHDNSQVGGWQKTRVYSFDFGDMRFGQGILKINLIVEPRPNVVTSSRIVATGICTIVIPKDAS